MSSLGEKITKGIAWVSAAKIAQKIFSLAYIAIVARLLSPDDFGIAALAVAFMAIITLLADIGIAPYIVYVQKEDDELYSTAFWLGLFLGILVFLISILMSWFIGKYYHKPILTPLIILIGLRFLISSFSLIPLRILQKQMRFKEKSMIELVVYFIEAIAIIILAFEGFKVWSLILPGVFVPLITLYLSFRQISWRPKKVFNLDKAFAIWKYGKHILGVGLLTYLQTKGDVLIYGKLFTATFVGYFTLAFDLVFLIPQQFMVVFTQVFFSAFAKIQNDIHKVSENYMKVTRYILIIFVIPLFFLIIYNKEIVNLIYSSKWSKSAELIPLIALSGIFFLMFGHLNSIVQSLGKSDAIFKLESASAIIKFACVIFFVYFLKEKGIVWAIFSHSILTIPFKLYVIKKYLKISYAHYLKYLLKTFSVLLVICFQCYFFKAIISSICLNGLYVFAITGMITLLIYAIYVLNQEEELVFLVKKNLSYKFS